ncbi:MAG: DegT/DnrJ/EryC1/StrS family aminotransferase [Candidatus Peribacteraceae bacterium]|nr:DegT/DnrJ/EryC1/StrS family aminotransferase [Candidatus Peribacteraceae bacterium]
MHKDFPSRILFHPSIRPIHHTFGPLATRAQLLQAFLLQFQPWKWHDGKELQELKEELARLFPAGQVSLFDTGRGALLALLRALELAEGDEVILQGFTCAVVPNAIIAAGGKPVYVDIHQKTLALDPALVRAAVTRRTRAIICQHTFGIPADTSALRLICNEKDIALIEDCAHVIPDGENGKIGMHGDAILLSFGRDKAVSGVSGGAIVTRHALIAKRLCEMEARALRRSSWHILNLVGYPLRYACAKMMWPLRLAKAYLHGLRLLRLLPPVLRKQEKAGRAETELFRMPNACAILTLEQLRSLTTINAHRRSIAQLYGAVAQQEHWESPKGALLSPALQKFPLFVKNAESVRQKLKSRQIYLDDGWCGAVVNPRTVNERAVGYCAGSCPNAEDVSQRILTLPTHPTMTRKQAETLLDVLGKMLHTTGT